MDAPPYWFVFGGYTPLFDTNCYSILWALAAKGRWGHLLSSIYIETADGAKEEGDSLKPGTTEGSTIIRLVVKKGEAGRSSEAGRQYQLCLPRILIFFFFEEIGLSKEEPMVEVPTSPSKEEEGYHVGEKGGL